MTWTQGQPIRTNQSPFLDPETEDRNKKPPVPNNYSKPNTRRNDYNQRQQSFTPNTQPNNIAATFTQEGLQTFSLIFSSAVEAAIAKSLPDIVEKAVERKLQDLLHQAKSELNELAESVVSQIIDQSKTTLEAYLNDLSKNHATETEASVQTPQDAVECVITQEEAQIDSASEVLPVSAGHESVVILDPTPSHAAKPRRGKRMSGEEVDVVVQTLKDLGRPVKTDELRSLIQGVEWGSNPSVKMTNLMNRSNGQIERTGRGVYEYKSVNR